jgi:SulP family sulfate permease
MSVAALGFGMTLLQVFPNFLLGGLTIFLGLCMLKGPCLDSFWRLSRLEYGSILLITTVIAFFGFVNGVLVGLLVAFIFFVISSSRVKLVKFAGSCATIQSQEIRSRSATALLQQRGCDVRIFALQGFVFFGNAFELYRRLRGLFGSAEARQPLYLLLDFRDVVGVDSSGMTWIGRLAKLAKDHQAVLVLSGLSAVARRQLLGALDLKDPTAADPNASIHLAADMDEALQWCECRLLAAGDGQGGAADSAGSDLASLDAEAAAWRAQFVAKASPYLQRQTYQAGAILWRHGEAAFQLYLVESGDIELIACAANGERKRCIGVGSDSVFGEVAFFLQSPRIGTATFSQDSVVYCLTRDQLQAMASQEPALALELQNRVLLMESMLLAEDFRSIDFMMR